MKAIFIILIASAVCLYSCKDAAVNNPPDPVSNYKKIMDAVSGNVKFEFYGNGTDNFAYGYNDIGFKVFLNSQEQTTGFVKFKPKYFDVPTPGSGYKSTPVSNSFEYNSTDKLFKGYVNFIMATQGNLYWFGNLNYNDQSFADSVSFNVRTSSQAQVLRFRGVFPDTNWYCMTLMTPYYPKQGKNDFKCMLHRSSDELDYVQVESAEMYIRPWMESMGHGSPGNINPAHSGNGVYTGKVNLSMSGTWAVYDSIKVNGNFITSSPPPKFMFECP